MSFCFLHQDPGPEVPVGFHDVSWDDPTMYARGGFERRVLCAEEALSQCGLLLWHHATSTWHSHIHVYSTSASLTAASIAR